MAVRIAGPADAAVVAGLLTDFNNEFESWVPPIEVLEDRFTDLLARGDVLVLLAHDPEPVGFALVTMRPSPYFDGPIAVLDELYVVPRRQGQGLGSQLMELLGREAEAGDVGEIHINVDEGDLRARRFYESHGFTNVEHGERMLCYLKTTYQK